MNAREAISYDLRQQRTIISQMQSYLFANTLIHEEQQISRTQLIFASNIRGRQTAFINLWACQKKTRAFFATATSPVSV